MFSKDRLKTIREMKVFRRLALNKIEQDEIDRGKQAPPQADAKEGEKMLELFKEAIYYVGYQADLGEKGAKELMVKMKALLDRTNEGAPAQAPPQPPDAETYTCGYCGEVMIDGVTMFPVDAKKLDKGREK